MAPITRCAVASVTPVGDEYRSVRQVYDGMTAADRERAVLVREAAQPAATSDQGR